MLHRDRVFFWVWLLLVFSPRSRGDSHEKESQLICSDEPVVALAGEDVILPCHLEPPLGPGSGKVLWTRPGLYKKFILVYHQGQMIREEQNPSYEKRTALFEDQLKDGNVSLKLSRVKFSDAGRYLCTHEAAGKSVHVNLTVAAVSTPLFRAVLNDTGYFLKCEFTGWFPEPQVSWLHNGSYFSVEPAEVVKHPDGLLDVHSMVQVKTSGNYTCRVHQKNMNQSREVHIHVKGELVSFLEPPSVLGLTSTILGSVVVIVFTMRQTYIHLKRYVGVRGVLAIGCFRVAVLMSVVKLLENRSLSEDVFLLYMVGFTVLLCIADVSHVFIILMKKYDFCDFRPDSKHLNMISHFLFVTVVVMQFYGHIKNTNSYYWMGFHQFRHLNLLCSSMGCWVTLTYIITMTESMFVFPPWDTYLTVIVLPLALPFLSVLLVLKCIRWILAKTIQLSNDAQLFQMFGRLMQRIRKNLRRQTRSRAGEVEEQQPMTT